LSYQLRYTTSANKQFIEVQKKDAVKHRKFVKCLRKLGEDPKQSGLNPHKYDPMTGPNGEEVWESYVENKTPAAWRVFWCYGPDQEHGVKPDATVIKVITVVAITPHPLSFWRIALPRSASLQSICVDQEPPSSPIMETWPTTLVRLKRPLAGKSPWSFRKTRAEHRWLKVAAEMANRNEPFLD